MSFWKSLILSLLIYSLALFVTSYGYQDSFPFAINIISIVILLISSMMLASDVRHILHFHGIYHDNLLAFLMSAICSLAVGQNFILGYALATFFMILSFHLIENSSYSSEPMASQLFKLMLLLFLMSIIEIKLFWLAIFLIYLILFFRGPILKDIATVLISWIALSAISLWIYWYFDIPFINLSDLLLTNIWNVTPKFDVHSFSLSVTVLLISAVMTIVTWFFTATYRENSDNIAIRFVSSIYLLMIIFTVLLFMTGVSRETNLVAFIAIPYAVIFYILYRAVKSAGWRRFLMTIFLLVTIIVLSYDLFMELK